MPADDVPEPEAEAEAGPDDGPDYGPDYGPDDDGPDAEPDAELGVGEPSDTDPPVRHRSELRRGWIPHPAIIVVLILASIFGAFYAGWLGRSMSDEEIEAALVADAEPADFQHAIEHLTRRMTADSGDAARFYPVLVELSREAKLPDPQLRLLVVWAMQYDKTKSVELREALAAALTDSEPLVRWNAATSLARHGDARARPALLEMLAPFTVTSPGAGMIKQLLDDGRKPDVGRRLARLEREDGSTFDVNAPFDALVGQVYVQLEQTVAEGTRLMNLRPRSLQAMNALAALYLVGSEADLPVIDRYASGAIEGLSDAVAEQAKRAGARIRQGPLAE